MPTVLETLLAQRDTAQAALEEHTRPILAEKRALTPDEETRHAELRGVVVALDARITEIDDDEIRKTRIAEARTRAGIPAANAPAVVRSEPSVYGEGTGQSYYADMAWAAMPGDQHFRDAQDRLAEHGRNVIRDCVNNLEERKRVGRAAREHYRKDSVRGRQFVDDIETRALELRAMDTTGASGGAFVTPQYLVDDYAPFRTPGRVFINATNLQPLPEYGMTVYLPVVNAAAGVATQAQQNSGIVETDPNVGYLSSNLVTEAGQVGVAQQLLDRAGPGVAFDKMVFDELTRSYGTAIDQAVILAAMANAGTVTDAHTTAGGPAIIQDFYSDVATAMGQMETAPGLVLSPTHQFVPNLIWAWLSSQLGSDGRPLIVPSAGMPFNAIAAAMGGKELVVPEGATGYEVQSLPVFKELSIPTSGGNGQLISAHMPEVWVWEGEPVTRAVPQTKADTLTVLLQLYSYWTCIVRYPKAIQVVSGARYATPPSYTYA